MNEKTIWHAKVELKQGHDVKAAFETGKAPDFDREKTHLEIIKIEEIMAENGWVNKDEAKFYTPSHGPMEKEKRKLALVQERYNKVFDNAYKIFENQKEISRENMKKCTWK